MKLLLGLTKKQTILLVSVVLIASLTSFVVVQAITKKNRTVSTSVAEVAPVVNNCDADMCVSIEAEGASPDTLTVVVGQTVQFNSNDGMSHNLTTVEEEAGSLHEDHGELIEITSGEFAADEGWRVQFKKAGTYVFRDTLNKKVNILVVAYTPGANLTIE